MESVFIFIVVLGVLIFFHELGHFLIAKLFGVGVERFSLGFGPRIFGKKIGRTDYRVSIVPLGGYVKMIGDEPNAPLDPEDVPVSFTHKHVAKRSLIVAAGPLFNILLAVIIFSMVFFFSGLPSIRPIVRDVQSNSPAERSGIQQKDLIQVINGKPVSSWMQIEEWVAESDGEPLSFTIERDGKSIQTQVQPRQVSAQDVFGDEIIYYDIGISGVSQSGAVVDRVMPNMPAEKAGLQKGDMILAVDGHPIESWETMHEIVSSSKGRPLIFKIKRDDRTFEVDIQPKEVQEKDLLGAKQSVYRIGILRGGPNIPEQDRVTVDFNIFEAIREGMDRTWYVIAISVKFFGKMFQGQVPVESIGGPIRIAQMAQQQANEGLIQLFFFMAAVSVQLAILNLLPIPVLDGGHLLFFGIEAVQRRPVSTRLRETAQQIGIFLLILLMIFVFYNDITLTWFR